MKILNNNAVTVKTEAWKESIRKIKKRTELNKNNTGGLLLNIF